MRICFFRVAFNKLGWAEIEPLTAEREYVQDKDTVDEQSRRCTTFSYMPFFTFYVLI